MSRSVTTRFTAIATIHSPYKQKFAIPRQANLVPEAEGEIVFTPEFSDPNCLRGLEGFSHLWLLFIFHETAAQGWSPTVQPPRLGGRQRVGVFASRSPFRPNPLGLSVVRNLGTGLKDGRQTLRVGGIDLLDETPIVDIKPYLPYADRIDNAEAGFAEIKPGSEYTVEFSESASNALVVLENQYHNLRQLITGILRQDPRPAWRVKTDDDKQYGMSLYDLNIKWRIEGDRVIVLAINPHRQTP